MLTPALMPGILPGERMGTGKSSADPTSPAQCGEEVAPEHNTAVVNFRVLPRRPSFATTHPHRRRVGSFAHESTGVPPRTKACARKRAASRERNRLRADGRTGVGQHDAKRRSKSPAKARDPAVARGPRGAQHGGKVAPGACVGRWRGSASE